MKKKKLIMCDCFGVISSCVLPPWFLKHFGEEKGPALCKFYCDKGDLGEYTLFELAKIMEKEYGFDKAENIYAGWINNTVCNYELLDYLKSLKGEYEIALASNALPGLVETVFEKNKVDASVFDKIFISYQMHEVKPHKEYYLKIINSYDYKFEKMYMIDDRLSNFVELDEIGVEGILYTDLESLKKKLY